ncbi:LacI family transcriptional regulator [Ktedonobacteria bacterium brp13]|nr:LacI family transcriptional regulator [Ktedonobacteria bacterium brp13]
MPTMKDVAQKAGVGLGTVSRVLNKSGYVSEEAQQKVWEAVKQLRYVPNGVAQSMVTKHSYTLGVVLPDFTNPFFPGLARGIENEARKHGYTIIMIDTDWQEHNESQAIDTLRQRSIDGALLVASANALSFVHRLCEAKIPVVLLDRGVEDLDAISQVTVDHYKGACKAMAWAYEKGYTRVGFLSGPAKVSSANLRLRGYLDAIGRGDVAVDEIEQHPELPVVRADFSFEKGRQATEELLRTHPDVTCIFAANDLSALGALSYLTARGIAVPDDIAIIGFDDILMATLVHPSLTTIRQPTYEMGTLAARLLLQQLADPRSKPEKHILEPTLIVRQTC